MILSRLHKGTNNRLAYYGKNLVRYITPKVLLRNRLQKVLAELEKRPDKEYILRRVDYYNKMQGIVPIDPVSSHRLADHKFGDARDRFISSIVMSLQGGSAIPCTGIMCSGM